MNTSLKNPCHQCDHHLAGKDKNCDRCRECDRRVEYVNAIGTCHSASMSEHVDLEGHSSLHGGKARDHITEVSLSAAKSEADADKKPAEEYSIEDRIADICERNGTTLAAIRKGIQGRQDKAARKEFHAVRDQIIEYLWSQRHGKFTQGQIGDLLNVSASIISTLIKDRGIPGPEKKQKTKPKPAKPAPAKPKEKPPREQPPKTMVLKFDKHPEVYDQIHKLAEERLRKPENQALWILLKVHERGLAIPEV